MRAISRCCRVSVAACKFRALESVAKSTSRLTQPWNEYEIRHLWDAIEDCVVRVHGSLNWRYMLLGMQPCEVVFQTGCVCQPGRHIIQKKKKFGVNGFFLSALVAREISINYMLMKSQQYPHIQPNAIYLNWSSVEQWAGRSWVQLPGRSRSYVAGWTPGRASGP
jgi:hypothetical protein